MNRFGIQILFLTLVFFVTVLFNLHENPYLLLFIGIWNSIFYASWFKKLILTSPNKLNPIIIYLFISVLYCGIGPALTAYNIFSAEHVRILTYYPTQLVYGAILLTLEQLIISYAFIKGSGDVKNNIEINNINTYKMVKIARYAYVVFFLFNILNAPSLSVVFSYITNYGGIVIIFMLLLHVFNTSSAKPTVIFFILLTLITNVIFAMSGDSKELLLQPFIAVLLFLFLLIGYKRIKLISIKTIVPAVSIILLTLFIVYPLVNLSRHFNTKSVLNLIKERSISDSYKLYLNSRSIIIGEDNKSESEAILNRLSIIPVYSWALEYNLEKENIGAYFYKKGILSLIPRFLNPNKEPYQPGKEITRLINGYSLGSKGPATTQTANGIGGTALISGGIIAFVFITFLFGWFVGLIWKLIQPSLFYNPFSLLVYITLIRSTLRNFENFMDGGIPFFVISMIYILFAQLTNNYFKLKLLNENIIHR